MRKAFLYKVEINKTVEANCNQWLEICRSLYNLALEQRITAWKQRKVFISLNKQSAELPELKKVFPEFKTVGSQCLQNVLKRLDWAYDGFFRRIRNGAKPGFPRFKGRNRYDSFTLTQNDWRLEGKYLYIRNIGKFKLFLSRPIEGDIKTVTIRRRPSNKWLVCFSCNNVPLRPLPKTGKEIGIDVGCKSFLTDSEGNKIENPRFFKKSQELLAKRQQMLSRKKKGSNRRNKARILVAKIHEKIFNQRRDFHFKTANQLVKENDTIYIEELKSQNSWRSLNRSLRDVAWFGFFDILRFKAEEAGKEVIEVPAGQTSDLCSSCGAMVPKDLSIHFHRCSCGLTIDRHYNAAINILRLGQSPQANACESYSP